MEKSALILSLSLGLLGCSDFFEGEDKLTKKEIGIFQNKLKNVDTIINNDVTNGFPGGVLVVIKDGELIKETAYGYSKKYSENGEILPREEFVSMEKDTIFDLASNTKMYATNYAIMKLVAEEKLNIDEPIVNYISEYKGEGREIRTARELLTHSAGYAPEIMFFLKEGTEVISSTEKRDLGENFFSDNKSKTESIILTKVPFVYEKGTKSVYSDTDYMLLGILIERITGQNLDEYVEKNIYKPLGLKSTEYIPLLKGKNKNQIAATELHGNTRDGLRDYPLIRKNLIQGEVHDEKAYYSMNGISGHAGLFSTGKELAILAEAMLNNGEYRDVKLLNKEVISKFTKPSKMDITFGLGWRRAGNGDRRSQFGEYASNEAYGHTGWTGTVTVIDPKYNLVIVLLTNKKHSPVIKGIDTDSKFQGDLYKTGNYGEIISEIYKSF